MRISRLQVWLTFLLGIFLIATVVIFALFALAPTTAALNRPILLTGFVVALFLSLVTIAWLLRGLLRPYTQLIGEARRAPVAHSDAVQNEAEFVLETFQNVIAQLQTQQAELKRLSEQASHRADSAERFNDRIVASMPTGLIAFDANGQATVINAPARALFDGDAGQPGEHFRAIFATVPALSEMVESCLASGRMFRREEIEMKRWDHAKRLGATVAPIDPLETGTRGALCLLTDITEVMRLREQVALKRNLESLGEMSAGLAHEFKNAMAALHGYAQFLQSIDQDERGRAAAEALVQEVRSLTEMITAFLNFARPQPLQLEEVSLDELLTACLRELAPLFEMHQVQCVRSPTVTEGAFEAVIRADVRMLRQALLNLLRNAAEAIADGQADRRALVGCYRDSDQWAVITVQDTGVGIDTADLQKIFIPFFTTKSAGHGVGLALAHRVISEHGGTLTVANAPTGGAVFTIRLPSIS